jgi:ATP dependent DNA ligase-like protein
MSTCRLQEQHPQTPKTKFLGRTPRSVETQTLTRHLELTNCRGPAPFSRYQTTPPRGDWNQLYAHRARLSIGFAFRSLPHLGGPAASYLYAPTPLRHRATQPRPNSGFPVRTQARRIQSAHIWDGNCELVSRKRNAYKSFHDLRDNLAKLKVQNAVIDGEIVCLDEEGRSIFNELLFRRGSPIFYAFDLLYLNDRDLRQLPLIERKEKLRKLIEKSGLTDVVCGKYVEGRGVNLFNEVVRRNLEGVVAKRKNGAYATVSGWLKIKNPNYTQSERRHELFDSFKEKATNEPKLPTIPKKPPVRTVPKSSAVAPRAKQQG